MLRFVLSDKIRIELSIIPTPFQQNGRRAYFIPAYVSALSSCARNWKLNQIASDGGAADFMMWQQAHLGKPPKGAVGQLLYWHYWFSRHCTVSTGTKMINLSFNLIVLMKLQTAPLRSLFNVTYSSVVSKEENWQPIFLHRCSFNFHNETNTISLKC